jgi:hypothetical protein
MPAFAAMIDPMMHIRLSAVRCFRVRVTAVALALVALSATADDSAFDIAFYLNTNSRPVTRLDRLPDMTDPLRAVLAMYAFQAGAGCNADRGPGFDCNLTQARPASSTADWSLAIIVLNDSLKRYIVTHIFHQS